MIYLGTLYLLGSTFVLGDLVEVGAAFMVRVEKASRCDQRRVVTPDGKMLCSS